MAGKGPIELTELEVDKLEVDPIDELEGVEVNVRG